MLQKSNKSLGCKFSQLQYYHILLKSINIPPSNCKNKTGNLKPFQLNEYERRNEWANVIINYNIHSGLIPFPLGWWRLALSSFSVAVWPLLFATSRESSRRLPCVVEATDSATSSPAVFAKDSSLQLIIGSWRVQNVVRAVWNVSHKPVF